MVKKRSITRFVILSIIALVLVLLTVCSFTIPGTTTNYNGFIGSIPLGLDFSSGYSVVYNSEKSSSSDITVSETIDQTLPKLDRFLSYHGFSEYTIAKQGDDQIKIEVLDDEYSSTILGLLESPQQIYFTVEQYSEEEGGNTNPESYLGSSDISFAQVGYDQSAGVYGINISLTGLGRISLQNLITQANNIGTDTVYIYVGEIGATAWGTISVSDLKDGMFIQSSSASNTNSAYSTAYQTASNIFVGTFGVNLTQDSLTAISPRLGDNAWMLTLIAFLVFIIAIMIFFAVRYGDLGLLASFAMIFFVTLQLFFMQAIPFVMLDMGGAVAMFMSVLLFALSAVLIMERIGKEYALGNRIHVSCKNGFRRSFWRIFDLHIIVLVTSVVMLLIGQFALSYFGGVMFIASIVSMFCLYVLFRFFVNTYLPLNSTKPQKMRLYREANVKEIKEEVEIIPEDKADSLKGGDNNG